jgi:hypothetical protein
VDSIIVDTTGSFNQPEASKKLCGKIIKINFYKML